MNGFPDERRRIIIIAAAAVGVVGLLFGGWLWWQARTQVSTDDAYVEGAVTVISAKVSGNIAEMLVQCDNGEIRLLPALPSAWPLGRVTGLRARGGFEIDLSWKNGSIESVSVRSLLGQALRLRRGEAV